MCLCVRPPKSVIASEFDWTCVECQISVSDKDYTTVAPEPLWSLKVIGGHMEKKKNPTNVAKNTTGETF